MSRSSDRNRYPAERPQKEKKTPNHADYPPAHKKGEGAVLDAPVAGPPPEEQEHRAHEWRFWKRQIRVAQWLNGITLAGAVVALGALVVLYLSIVGADDATMRANRAWLAPAFMTLNWPLEQVGPVGITIHVENVGREPAIGVTYRLYNYSTQYIPRGPGGAVPYNAIIGANPTCGGLEPDVLNGAVVYPGSTKFWIVHAFEDTPDNRQIAADAAARKKTLVVEGCVAYRTFDQKHTSRFRFFLRDVDG